MISIGTDIGNLILENTLDKNTIGLNNSIERMTTGYKINRAKDDAAGYSIATDLNTKISSMLMVQQNNAYGTAEHRAGYSNASDSREWVGQYNDTSSTFERFGGAGR